MRKATKYQKTFGISYTELLILEKLDFGTIFWPRLAIETPPQPPQIRGFVLWLLVSKVLLKVPEDYQFHFSTTYRSKIAEWKLNIILKAITSCRVFLVSDVFLFSKFDKKLVLNWTVMTELLDNWAVWVHAVHGFLTVCQGHPGCVAPTIRKWFSRPRCWRYQVARLVDITSHNVWTLFAKFGLSL